MSAYIDASHIVHVGFVIRHGAGDSQRTHDEIATTITTAPVCQDFLGVTLGMDAEEVRTKLRHLKDKGERQDFFVFSESQSAQTVYDDKGKLIVISVDYVGNDSSAPSPVTMQKI